LNGTLNIILTSCTSKISSQIGIFTHNLPKIWAHPITQNLHPELLLHFQKQEEDSVMMLASTRETWLIMAFHNHFLVLRLWCMIQTNWRPVSTSRMPNAPNSQLEIILELIWNKQQFESDEAFQNLTYWKGLRICKLNVLIQNLTTCVSLKQNSHKFQVSTLCHTLIHWQEAQEWCFA
jgi:hypothetical protein